MQLRIRKNRRIEIQKLRSYKELKYLPGYKDKKIKFYY